MSSAHPANTHSVHEEDVLKTKGPGTKRDASSSSSVPVTPEKEEKEENCVRNAKNRITRKNDCEDVETEKKKLTKVQLATNEEKTDNKNSDSSTPIDSENELKNELAQKKKEELLGSTSEEEVEKEKKKKQGCSEKRSEKEEEE